MIKGNISQMQSQNEYAYCLGNPLMYVDRDGRVPVVAAIIIAAGRRMSMHTAYDEYLQCADNKS